MLSNAFQPSHCQVKTQALSIIQTRDNYHQVKGDEEKEQILGIKECQIKQVEQRAINTIKFRSFNIHNEDPVIYSTLHHDKMSAQI